MGVVLAASACQVAMAGPQPGTRATYDSAIQAALHVNGNYTLQDLTLPPAAGAAFQVTVNLGGGDYTLHLTPHSVRADGFRLIVADDAGQHQIDAPAPTTYRGWIDQAPGAVVAASLIDGQLEATIALEDGFSPMWFVQPLTDAGVGAPAATHVVYSADDGVYDPSWVLQIADNPDLQGAAAVPADGGHTTRGLRTAEVGFDADFPFFQRRGSSTTSVLNDIDNVLNGLIVVYERDVGVTFQNKGVIIRTTSGSDPYTTSVPDTLLNQVRNVWNTQDPIGTNFDLAELMSGRNLSGSVIGIAWLSSVCTSRRYSVVQTTFSSSLNQRVALSAHEMGHNFGADHCSGSSCHIMCAGLGGCGGIGLPNFGPAATSQILAFLASGTANCVGSTPPPPDFTVTMEWSVEGGGPAQVEVGRPITLVLSANRDAGNYYAGGKFNVRVTGLQFTDSLDTGGGTVGPEPAGDFTLGRAEPYRNFPADGSMTYTLSGTEILGSALGDSIDHAVIPPILGGSPPRGNPTAFWKVKFIPGPTLGTRTFMSQVQSAVVGDASDLPADAAFNDGQITVTVVEATSCPADLDGDGDADVADFFVFVAAFAAGDPIADINGDGSINVADFFAFVAAFAAGCP